MKKCIEATYRPFFKALILLMEELSTDGIKMAKGTFQLVSMNLLT